MKKISIGLVVIFLLLIVFHQDALPEEKKENSPFSQVYNKNNPQNILQEFIPTVVYITTKTVDERNGDGSGFIVDNSGIIITCFHVVETAKEINVILKDGRKYPVVSIINYDPDADICFLKIGAINIPRVSLGDSDNIKAGQEIYCIGVPTGKGYALSKGVILGQKDFNNFRWVIFTASIVPGFSGGPLFNFQGQVIGLVSRGEEKFQYGNVALAINEIKDFVRISPEFSLKEFTQIICPAAYYYKLGKESELKGDFDEAIFRYDKAIKINPNFGQPYFRMAFINSIKKKYEKAWEYLHAAESAQFKVPSEFYDTLKRFSGREK